VLTADGCGACVTGTARNLHVARVLDILFDCHDALSELTASPIIASSASERRSQLGARLLFPSLSRLLLLPPPLLLLLL
jgi:hypothetical protein